MELAISQNFRATYEINEPKQINESYYAYLRGLDSSGNERKELFQKVIKDPQISYLFFINGHPTTYEKQMLIKTIAEDVKSSYNLLKTGLLDDDDRKFILGTVLEDPQYSYYTVSNYDTTEEEIGLIYECHKRTYFEINNIDLLIKYYEAFREVIDNIYLEKIINIVYDKQLIDMAKKILTLSNNLPEDLKDKLESLFVIYNLGN